MSNVETDYQVDREDLLLLLVDAAERILGSTELRGITRLEKLIFLLEQEEHLSDVSALYSFEPYKFGPFSADVYNAADFLRGIDFLKVSERPVTSYYATSEEERLTEMVAEDDEENNQTSAMREKIFALTDTGKRAAESLRMIWQNTKPEDLAKIDTVMKRFGRLPLNQLIRYVYRKFPQSAEKSIHPVAKELPAR